MDFGIKKDVKINEITAYHVARKNDWLSEFRKDMPNTRKENGFFSKEKCCEIIKKCETWEEFRKNIILHMLSHLKINGLKNFLVNFTNYEN